MGRHIFVGDIQGCRQELEQLLERVRLGPGDRVHPVGDLVNRGPDSAGVLRLLRGLDADGVLGNHDVALLRTAAGRRALRRSDTFGDVLAAPDRADLLGWLGRQPLVLSLPGQVLVHAGLNPAWPDPVAALAGIDPLDGDGAAAFALTVRYCSSTGERPKRDDPPPGPPFRPWFEHWAGREARVLVFGHWARLGLVHRPGVRGLDTGCVWGGRLTAWIAEEDRFVFVPARKAWAVPGAG